jgi:hypothetical protein
MNVDGDAPRALRKRGRSGDDDQKQEAGGQKRPRLSKGSSHEMSGNMDQDKRPAPGKRPTRKTNATQLPVTKLGSQKETSLTHVLLRDTDDVDAFAALVHNVGHVPNHNHILEIHVDASKSEEYDELRLAVALQSLHPKSDGTNPHRFRAIKIVVKGNVLYTRYRYHLASPATSKDASEQLQEFVNAGRSRQADANLAYKIISTERIVARALLGEQNLIVSTACNTPTDSLPSRNSWSKKSPRCRPHGRRIHRSPQSHPESSTWNRCRPASYPSCLLHYSPSVRGGHL